MPKAQFAELEQVIFDAAGYFNNWPHGRMSKAAGELMDRLNGASDAIEIAHEAKAAKRKATAPAKP